MAQITLRDYLQQTEDAISSSRVDDALTHCQLMLSYFPESLEIQRQLGEVYLAQERLAEAQQIFDWVLTNDPENVLAYCNRADVSERLAEYDIALDCYQQAYELSRGNNQIRQEFDRLSQKVGQKGFMFSRAGLARLYMRGGLLSQAMQEWDAVLTTTPDRVDARTGQLESFWRAGQLEDVDQLAQQILHDVPGCLKALLLQACVIFPRDSQRAQELLLRAQALDPDFVLAQELFADALAKQPDDPFLQQLKKAPALLNLAAPATIQDSEQPSGSFPPSLDVAFGNPNIANALAQWGDDPNWNNDTTLIKPQHTTPYQNGSSPSWELEGVHDSPSLSGMSLPISNSSTSLPSQGTSQGSGEHSLEPWELLQNALNQFGTNETTNPYEQDLPLWNDSPALDQTSQDASPATSWTMPNQQENTSLPGIDLDVWNAPPGETPSPAKESVPNPPTWINMLAQSNTASMGNDLSAPTLDSQYNNEQSFANPLLRQLDMTQFSSTASADAAESQPSLPQFTNAGQVQDDSGEDEESFFGPAWLKSLGAATLTDGEIPVTTPEAYMETHHSEQQPQPALPSNEPVSTTNPYDQWLQNGVNNSPDIHENTSWTSAAQMQQSQNIQYENWSPRVDTHVSDIQPPMSPVEPLVPSESAQENIEQNLVTTLEELELSLRSQGFIPLEPNSLATVASKTQESSVSSYASDPVESQEVYNPQDFQESTFEQEMQDSQKTFDPPSLSSTLEQSASIGKQPTSPLAIPPDSSFETVRQNEEPSWLQALKSAPAIPTVPATPTLPNTSIEPAAYADLPGDQTEQSQQYRQLQEVFSHFQPTPTPLPQPEAQEHDIYELSQTTRVDVEPVVSLSDDVKQAPASIAKPLAKELQETVKVSALNRNPLLDGGLETTMKRPAVRLQPMQPHSLPSQPPGGARIISRVQSGERIEKATRKATKTNGENLSYRDRLLKGYQHQLVGDYDEAMQEYRIIIRSATDLLSEVVSNVRALLKLAPNYAAGYRVLGDAYMRQGEYLQAMEAYNKALSMTKKLK